MNWSTIGPNRSTRYLPKKLRFDLSGRVPKPIYCAAGKKNKAKHVAELMATRPWVAVDTEYDPDTEEMILWSISDGKRRVCLHPEHLPLFKDLLQDEQRPKKVFHNALADVPVFRKQGLTVPIGADTMSMDFWVDETRAKSLGGPGPGLKACARDWLGINQPDFLDVFGEGKSKKIENLREKMLSNMAVSAEYASMDAYATFWLFQLHRKILQGTITASGATMWDVFCRVEPAYLESLADINRNGIAVDVDILDEVGAELDKTVARCRWVMQYLLPKTIKVPAVKDGVPYKKVVQRDQLNINSAAELAAVFYDTLGRTSCIPKKPRTTCDEALQAWAAAGCQLADTVSTYRAAHKQRKDFIGYRPGDPRAPKRKGDSAPSSVMHYTQHEWGTHGPWVVRTRMSAVAAVTGRNAASRPPMQQVPQVKDLHKIRRAFTVRPKKTGEMGSCLIVADYSMAELRVLAHLAQDKKMIRVIKAGEDIHSTTAKAVFHLDCPVEEVKEKHKELRTKAKAVNFGIAYGMGPESLGRKIGVSTEEAKRIIDTFYSTYKGVARWTQAIHEHAHKFGYVETLLGRRRRFPKLKMLRVMDPYDAAINGIERQAVNAPIQGGVADILRIAMGRLRSDPELVSRGVKVLLQIHDELILECAEIDRDFVLRRVKEIMQGAMDLLVPLVVDAHAAENWYEGKQEPAPMPKPSETVRAA